MNETFSNNTHEVESEPLLLGETEKELKVLADSFGYTFANPETRTDDTTDTGKVDDNPFLINEDENYSSKPSGDDNDDWATATAAISCALCCFFSFAFLIIGVIFIALPSDRQLSGLEVAGLVLLSVGVLFILAPLACCGASLVTCALPGTLALRKTSSKRWEIQRLNDQYTSEKEILKNLRFDIGTTGSKMLIKQCAKEEENKKEERKNSEKRREELIKTDLEIGLDLAEIHSKRRPVMFKVVFNGDIYVSTIDLLREQISLCLVNGCKHDTVCVVVTSGGGAVTMYGLAAAQLGRVRKAGMRLVVCVDSIAASGGYLMAAMADKILASPFAMIGSIGVISIVPNVQKLLERFDINTYVFTAGEYKRTVDVVGDVTEKGKEKMIEQLNAIHRTFKEHICIIRPALSNTIDEVANGEAWLAVEGKKKGLVDIIMTSDEYFSESAISHDIIQIEKKEKKSFFSNIFDMTASVLKRQGLFTSAPADNNIFT